MVWSEKDLSAKVEDARAPFHSQPGCIIDDDGDLFSVRFDTCHERKGVLRQTYVTNVNGPQREGFLTKQKPNSCYVFEPRLYYKL